MGNYYNNETLLEQQAEIEKLKAERDALAAQVEALQSTAAKVVTGDAEIAELEPLLDAPPQQHLAEIRAEAIEQAATYLSESIPDQSHKSVIIEGGYVYISTRYLRQYADSIRQGEVK